MNKTVRDMLAVLAPAERTQLAWVVAAEFIISLLDIFFLAALLFVVAFFTSGIHSPAWIAAFDGWAQKPLLPIFLFFVAYSLKNYAGYEVSRKQFDFLYAVASRISAHKLLQYLQGPYSEFTGTDSSVYQHRISQQPVEFSHYVLRGFLQICSQVLLLLSTLAAILWFNATLFGLLFLLLAPPVLLTGFYLKKKLHATRKEVKTASERSLRHLREALSGFVESRVYGRKKFFTRRYQLHQQQMNNALAAQQSMQHLPSRLMEVFAVFGLFILVCIQQFTHQPGLSLITIGAFITACYKIIPGAVKIMNSLAQIRTYAHTCTDLGPHQCDHPEEGQHTGAIGSIWIDNITYRFRHTPILNRFSLSAGSGDFIGLSGASGKGKTTLLNVLLGFLAPHSGSISLNDNRPASGWQRIAYVKQQPFILNDTIRTNIILHEGPADEQRLQEVVRVTGVGQIAASSPLGLDLQLTEEGRNLSGGQRQRIALARALYKEADLLILDEPFSELDAGSEEQMMQHLQQVALNGKIVLLITHNKAALQFCNKTVSLDD